MKRKKGYLVALAGLGLFAACYFLEILLGSQRHSAGCFAIPAYFVMGVAFLIGTVMVALAKGHSLGFGVIMGLIAPLGLLIVTLVPERAKRTQFHTRSSEEAVAQFLTNLERKDG